MDERLAKKQLRNAFSKQGWVLLIYNILMSTLVSSVMVFDVLVRGIVQGFDVFLDEKSLEKLLMEAASNGWGYILSCILGGILLLVWKKKDFCFHRIWVVEHKMTLGSFIGVLSVLLASQALFQAYAIVIELLSQLLGGSIMESLEMATSIGDSFSMFLYAGIFAPIFEEILFRGLLLRSFQSYGKKFAIFASAFLFGIFHGNIVQTPWAFVVGLLLGYVTVEYSIGWAMLLHMINNLVLGDMMSRLLELLPTGVGDIVFYAVLFAGLLAGVVFAIVQRDKIRSWHRIGKLNPICVRSFFTSPGILVFCGMMLINILLLL